MKTKSLIVVMLLFMGSITPSMSQQDIKGSKSVRVRILSYNIFHGETMKGDFDLDIIAAAIMKTSPDLVALQEVDFRTRRAKRYDLATELGIKTGLVPLFGRAMHYDDGEYGEGILSSFSFLSTRNHPLPYSGQNEPRSALEITTILPSGDTIIFIGTHLDHTNNETDRILQAERINELLSDIKYPAILAGDLNAEPGSIPITKLEEFWGSTYDRESPIPTWPSDNPAMKIDYVMFHPKDRWKVSSAEVICDTVASDHCAFLVTLELLR